MSQLTITPLIKESCSIVLKDFGKQLESKSKLEFEEVLNKQEGEGVALQTLRDLLVYTKKSNNSPKYLHELLQGSKPYHFIPPPKPRNPELEKRCQKLKAELENKQYRKMVRHIIEPPNFARIKDNMELKAASSQMSIGINIIATMATTLTVGWYLGSRYFHDDVLGVCCGIVCCIIGMMVDMWLFVISGSSIDRHMEKQAQRKAKRSKLLPNYPGLVKYD